MGGRGCHPKRRTRRKRKKKRSAHRPLKMVQENMFSLTDRGTKAGGKRVANWETTLDDMGRVCMSTEISRMMERGSTTRCMGVESSAMHPRQNMRASGRRTNMEAKESTLGRQVHATRVSG